MFPLRGLDCTPEPVPSFVLMTVLGVRGTVPVLQRKGELACRGLQTTGGRAGCLCASRLSDPCSEGAARIRKDSLDCETRKSLYSG